MGGNGQYLSLQYQKPAASLARYVSGYHLYTVELAPGEALHDAFFPAWTNIRFTLDAPPWRVRIGRRNFDPVPAAALFGPTSHVGYLTSGSGVLAGVGITPQGWARFMGGLNASAFADRVTPLATVWPERTAELAAAIAEARDPRAVLEPMLLDLLNKTEPESPLVSELFELLMRPDIITVAEVTARLGLNPRALARLSQTHFGFTPKLLLRRARFMRALMGMQQVERGQWSTLVEAAGYHDQSHFVRDCRLFLGMPLGRFMALPKPMNEASMRLRTAVLGAPAQSLHLVQATTA